jgi:hypothetical protein
VIFDTILTYSAYNEQNVHILRRFRQIQGHPSAWIFHNNSYELYLILSNENERKRPIAIRLDVYFGGISFGKISSFGGTLQNSYASPPSIPPPYNLTPCAPI